MRFNGTNGGGSTFTKLKLPFAALLAGACLLVAAGTASAGTWPNSTNPEYTGPGSEPITHSLCKDFSGKDSCEFVTANEDRFLTLLPNPWVGVSPERDEAVGSGIRTRFHKDTVSPS